MSVMFSLIIYCLSIPFNATDYSPSDAVSQMYYDTVAWRELKASDGFVLDIKYATKDNFIGEAVYSCGRCFLRTDVAEALIRVNESLRPQGYKLKLFDCYRPRPAQYKLWKKVPNPNYVANPDKGSMHNRGSAVDLTLTDKSGKEIDMGTEYDFFGEKAHHDCISLPADVLRHRQKLKSAMEKSGFQSIRTEWWHYSLKGSSYPLDSWEWQCD
jgi:D-alanyl-D-alanine dipeptidase